MPENLHQPPKPIRSFKQYQKLHPEKVKKKVSVETKKEKPQLDVQQANSFVPVLETKPVPQTGVKGYGGLLVGGTVVAFLVTVAVLLWKKRIAN